MAKKFNFYNEVMLDKTIEEGGGGGGGDVTKEYVDTQDQALSNRITTNSNNINTLSTRANQLQTDVNDLGNNVSTLQTTVTNFDTTKANKSEVYTKTEVDTALNNKADKSTTYTKAEVDTELAKKLTATGADRGLNITSNKVGHSNSITVPTGKRIIQGTYDAQGHLTAIENEFNWSDTYNTSADKQLFTRKGANNMYTELRKVTRYTGNSAMTINNDGGLSSGADYSSEATRTINVVGKSAYFTCHLKYTSTASDAQWVKIGTIPTSLRPANYTTIIGQVYNNGQSSSSPYAGGNESAGGYVNTSGEVYLWVNKKYAGSNYQIRLTAQWFLS